MGAKEWLGFPDLWSGQKPWWNWYLTPVVNFGEGPASQIHSPHLQAGVLGIFSDILSSVQMLKREWSAESNSIYSSLVNCNIGSWVCCERPAFGQNCSLGAWVCSETPAHGQNTLMMSYSWGKTPERTSSRKLTKAGIEPGSTVWKTTILCLDHSSGQMDVICHLQRRSSLVWLSITIRLIRILLLI